jgi:hypothetical protein
LCNNFDITRIHNLFINIIETYNYYEDGKNKISDTDHLSEEISESPEYQKMKEYIDNNFKKIQDKWVCLLEELQKLKTKLNNIESSQDNDDALIKDNFKSQYKTIRINLEDIERELGKIKTKTEFEIKAIKEDDIQFDIYPITKNSMIFKSAFYVWFKKIFKNLQIINSDESEVGDKELEKNKKNFFKLYKKLIEKFNKDTIEAKEREIKVIILALKEQEDEFKKIYDSFIKTGGDRKGDDEGDVDGEDRNGEDGNGEGDNEVKVEGKVKGKGDGSKDEKDEGEGSGEVERLEEEADRLKKKAEEAKKKKEDDALAAAGASPVVAPVDEKVFNFEYNSNSCYVNSVLQMLIDNDELCDKIIILANKKLGDKFKDNETDKDKESDEYLLYLLNNIILYHRENRHSIGEPKKQSYNEYILPLRKYLIKKDTSYDFNEFGDCGIIFNYILQILQKLQIENNYYLITKNLDKNNEATSLETLIDGNVSIGNNINIIIEIIRSQTMKGEDKKALLTQNKQVIYESSKKPIILPHSLSLSNTKYNLKGFIHHIDGQHFVYYKLLNSENKEWVLLDDYDARNTDNEHIAPMLDSNKQKIVYDSESSEVLGNNGKIIKKEELPTDGSVLIYYKKDVNALNASPVARVEELSQDEKNMEKGIAASLAHAQPATEPVEVADTTITPFKYKYSFEKLEDTVGGNTPIYNNSDKPYYLNSTKNKIATFMASLNAGDPGLYVGGSQINKAFNLAIAGKHINNDTDLYKISIEMHEKFYTIVNSIKESLGVIYKYDNLQSNHTSNIYFEEMYLYKSEKVLDNFKFSNNIYPGDVFIEILKNNSWINGGEKHINNMTNIANKAMIYCIGPNGTVHNFQDAANKDIKIDAAILNANKDKKIEVAFLDAINIIGKNIANAINEYNKYKGNDNKKIDYVRICLISGNVFLPNSMKENGIPNPEKQELVAEALINGIHSVNSDSNKNVNNIVYNFAYAGGVFQKAFDKLKAKATDATLASAELIIP